MRFFQLFDRELADYNNYEELYRLASEQIVGGGWEVWLQVEWAKHLRGKGIIG